MGFHRECKGENLAWSRSILVRGNADRSEGYIADRSEGYIADRSEGYMLIGVRGIFSPLLFLPLFHGLFEFMKRELD